MTTLYRQLEAALGSIDPQNSRAKAWLESLILRCQSNARRNMDNAAHVAAVDGIRADFHLVQTLQADEEEQRELFTRADALIKQMEGKLRRF